MKIFNLQSSIFNSDDGSILIYMVVMIFIFTLVMLGLLSYATMELRVTRASVAREQAFEIAEAGANYYEWHLAYANSDYWDGNASTTPGPYVHSYVDSDTGQAIGQYSLTINQPAVGSTIVTVQSTGSTYAFPKTTRTVTVRYGIPSLAQYAFLANGDIWIGPNESVSGEMYSNGGIRFDGTGNAPIMSAKQTYTCQSWSGSPCPHTENGIWGSAPASTQAFWQYPVPNVDFSAITANFSSMLSAAQSNGIFLAPSNAQGYSLVFQNNGTVNVYKVTSLKNEPSGTDVNGTVHNTSLDYNARTLLYNKPLPANGIIFVEDNVWVEGMVTGRVTVAAAVLPYSASTAPSIMIPNNLCYTQCGGGRDSTSSLGLMSQQDVLLTYDAPNNLEVDGALIAQNGSDQNYYWQSGDIKNTITIFGAVASYGTWTWTWVDNNNNCISGYCNTNTTYDSNLLYAPPPSFPLSSAGYQQIGWASN